jgi:hypothetical protein
VRIVRKLDGYPENPLDGDVVSEGLFQRALDENLETNQTYYYAAYTYNVDGVFSRGKFLKVTTHEKILPRGAGNFTYRIITGTGRKRDNNTVGLWHMNEADENVLYDFSDSNLILTSNKNDTIWLSSTDVPDGTSGLRLDGSTYFSGMDSSNKIISNNFTIIAWIYAFNFSQNRNIFTREDYATSNLSYKFGIDTNGKLTFTLDDVTIAVSEGVLDLGKWQHVTVCFDTDLLYANFYLDGVFLALDL